MRNQLNRTNEGVAPNGAKPFVLTICYKGYAPTELN